jgi:hypothetical protein
MTKTMSQAEANAFVKRNVVEIVNDKVRVNGTELRGTVVAWRLRKAYEASLARWKRAEF